MAKKIMWIGITLAAIGIAALLLIGYDVIEFEKKPETSAKDRVVAVRCSHWEEEESTISDRFDPKNLFKEE